MHWFSDYTRTLMYYFIQNSSKNKTEHSKVNVINFFKVTNFLFKNRIRRRKFLYITIACKIIIKADNILENNILGL